MSRESVTRVDGTFLDLLYAEAPRPAFDDLVAAAEQEGATPEHLAELTRQHELALRLRELIARQRAREAELSALYETANDLTAIRDVDTILAAIVRRARQLLHADMTYLSLNDEEEGASYMRVTDGALTQEFRTLRLPLGTGLLGLVAQTGAPYYTEDYQADARFVHRALHRRCRRRGTDPRHRRCAAAGRGAGDRRPAGGAPDGAPDPGLRGQPAGLVRRARRPRPGERPTLRRARLGTPDDERARRIRGDRGAMAHDRLTDLLLHGGGVAEVAVVLAEVLTARLAIHAPDGELLAGAAGPAGWRTAVAEAVASGRSVPFGPAAGREGAGGEPAGFVSAAIAGTEHVATLVLHEAAADSGWRSAAPWNAAPW